MAKFFRNELGLILGILAAKNFQGKIWAWRPPGYSIQNGYKYDDYIISSSESRYGTGRGGYYADENGDYGIPVPDYVEENVSTKVVKIIQSYTGVVDKMVWRKF